MDKLKSIDVKMTRKKGKEICESYRVSLQLKRMLAEENYCNSTSVITVTNDSKSGNSIEAMYIDIATKNSEDIVAQFFFMANTVSKIDEDYETFLIQKYYYELSDDEIVDLYFGSSRRRFSRAKNAAHELVASMSNECVYKK